MLQQCMTWLLKCNSTHARAAHTQLAPSSQALHAYARTAAAAACMLSTSRLQGMAASDPVALLQLQWQVHLRAE
jgi:hypothetical protein